MNCAQWRCNGERTSGWFASLVVKTAIDSDGKWDTLRSELRTLTGPILANALSEETSVVPLAKKVACTHEVFARSIHGYGTRVLEDVEPTAETVMGINQPVLIDDLVIDLRRASGIFG